MGWCRKCGGLKPPRTHHCSVCKKCVLKMDHHCPWVNGCVGHNNYPPFFRMMAYVWLGCWFMVATAGGPFAGMDSGPGALPHNADFSSPRTRLTLTFIMSLAVGLAVSGLLGFHILLVRSGRTSIEFYVVDEEGGGGSGPYDLGAARNWAEVFGPRVLMGWWLPLPARCSVPLLALSPWSGPVGDGVLFPTRAVPWERGQDGRPVVRVSPRREEKEEAV